MAPTVIDNAKSALNAVFTAAPGIASQIDSAVGALATPVVDNLKQRIPNNCSIGTQLVCISYANNISCSKLPLNVSSLVSDAISSLPSTLADSIGGALREGASELQPVADRLNGVLVHFRQLLVLGGVLMLVPLCIFLYFVFIWLSGTAGVSSRSGVRYQMVAFFSLGLVCCSPFILFTALFVLVQAKFTALPPWIEARSGEVSRLCFGALGCAVVMALLTAVTPMIVYHAQRSSINAEEAESRFNRSNKVRSIWASAETWPKIDLTFRLPNIFAP